MAQTIWKFLLQSDGLCELPAGAAVLSVQMQGDQPTLWALVNPDAERRVIQLGVYGTGHKVPDDPGRFVDTFQMHSGSLVFHVFQPTT